MAEEAEIEMPSRLPGGGPTGKAPLVRALRARQPDLKKVACLWLDRFHSEKYGALAELIGLVMAVADISGETTVMKEDLEERAPPEVVSELAAALVQEAVEKGADFSQHWLVSREKGAVRVRENFPAIWRELALAPNTEDLLGDLVQRLRAWTLSLAECQIRGIRHAATVAGLGLVEGMQIQCNHIQEWCDTAEVRLQDTESAKAALGKELKRNRQCLKNLRAARDGLAGTLLSKRSKDVEPDIRRSCCEALQRWAELGCEVTWKQYLHFLIQDREPKVRAAALQALVPLLRMREAAPLSAEVKSVAEELRPRVLERCQDPDATVAAAALCCACALAKAEVLKEEDFDPLIDLLWDAEAARRDAACIFVSRFVLNEDVMDLPGGAGTGSKRLLEMLLDFLHEFLDGHYELTERLVAALWRKASCLEDWEAMTALLLSEELKPEQHTVSAYLAEATVRWAVDEWLGTGSSHSEALLQHAARALGPRLPQLLAAFQSEKATMQKTASLCSHLLRFCSLSPQSSGGLAPEAVVKVLCSAFIRQTDPEALEHLALALAALLELSSATRGAVHDLAKSFHQNFLQLVPHANVSGGASPDGEVRMPDSLLANAQRLRILTKAYDVSLCDVEGFVTSALDLVAQRAEAESARCSVQGELVVILLELLTLISLRHAAQCSGPPLQSALGARDVRDEVQLKQAPTAAEDFLNLARLLLQRDEDPRVRTAAFAGALATLSAWWNAAQQSEQAEKPWSCGCSEQLQHALSDHLGKLLAEANTVPTDCVLVSGLGEPSASSAFSRLFVLLQQGLAEPSSSMLDGERVKAAQLCCLMVATCRHPEVALSSLPSLVLSLPLSPRDDLQQVAWTFLRRLRSEAHAGQAEEFFTMLLRAVKLVHEENTTAVAKDLSSRLLQHVGVGKLQPKWQDALMSVLRKGVAHASQGCSEGFLEALTPWITKHVVDDRRLEGLGTWAKEQENEALQKAGLEKLLEACEVTAKRTTEDTPPSKRRRTTKGNRKTPTSTQEIKDAMDLH